MIRKLLTKFLNNLKLHNKFVIMYVFCVIIPLVLTDAIVFFSIYEQEYNNRMYELENVANKYISTIESTVVYNARIARAICENEELNHFLDQRFESKSDFFIKYYDFVSKSFFKSLVSTRSDQVTIFVDNPSIADSVYFKHMYKAAKGDWYQKFKEMDRLDALIIFYDESADPLTERVNTFYYVRKMHLYDSTCEKLLRIDINSSELRSQLLRFSSEYPMYICNGNYVVFARFGEDVQNIDIAKVEKEHKFEVHKVYSAFGTDLDVYVFSDELLISSIIMSKLWIIVILLVFTLIVPILLMKTIEKSLSSRILKLETAFNGDQADKFQPISTVEGSDEISMLMENYNNIVSVNQSLINTLYKDKLREQETDLLRKNAELLALQSQINPHFLFNSLESIRMHSILKGEEETAEMVEKLAVMTRQNVEWGNDLVTIKKESESIEAYLYLQSYRFGDRLSFHIDVEKDCENYLIPKLTLVTFVENACVHGIESKSSAGWIFVRVYKQENDLCMEVEDTGGGMSEEEIKELLNSINAVSIDMIKGKKHVGILNACLRLKIQTDENVRFSIDSEVGVGVCVLIRIPMDKLRKSE
ncbi:MAG: sensor histidine kinase [Clostridiales bacterium]|nr:sensor histidine kinase [Clostridiales bacterium]